MFLLIGSRGQAPHSGFPASFRLVAGCYPNPADRSDPQERHATLSPRGEMRQPALTVRMVMEPNPVSVGPDQSVREALELMNRYRVGAVVVTRPDGSLAGVFTERDLLRRVATADPGWRELPVAGWMTPDPYTIEPDVGWEDAAARLERQKVRHLPVVEAGRVIGIVSARLLIARRAEYLNRQVEVRTRELKESHDLLLARDTELAHNLRAAGRLQTRLLLPNAPPDWAELGWGLHYAPLNHLGGDYYDLARPDPDHIGFLIADASGHSIAAAMVAIMSRIAFTQVSGRTVRPGEILAAMNDQLQGLADDRFVTAFYGVLHRRTRELTYANAGHPYPLRYVAATGEVQPLAARGFLLGIMPGEVYHEQSVRLEPGDRLCFYTDGLVEARDEIGEAFGPDQLRRCLQEHGSAPAPVLLNHLLARQRAFCGSHPPSDDVTVVIAELREAEIPEPEQGE